MLTTARRTAPPLAFLPLHHRRNAQAMGQLVHDVDISIVGRRKDRLARRLILSRGSHAWRPVCSALPTRDAPSFDGALVADFLSSHRDTKQHGSAPRPGFSLRCSMKIF